MEGGKLNLLVRYNVLEFKVLFCLVNPSNWIVSVKLWEGQLKVLTRVVMDGVRTGSMWVRGFVISKWVGFRRASVWATGGSKSLKLG